MKAQSLSQVKALEHHFFNKASLELNGYVVGEYDHNKTNNENPSDKNKLLF